MCQGSGGYNPYASTGYGLGGSTGRLGQMGVGQMGVGQSAFGGAPAAPAGYYGGANSMGASQPPFDPTRQGYRPAMPPMPNNVGEFSPRPPLGQMGVSGPTGAADQTGFGGFTPTARPLGSLGGQMGVSGQQGGLMAGLADQLARGGLGAQMGAAQGGGVLGQMATPGYAGMGPLWTTPPGGGPQPPAPPAPPGYLPPPSGGGGGTGGGTTPGMGASMPVDLGNAQSWMTMNPQDAALQYKYAPQQVRNMMDPVLKQRFGAGFQSTLAPYMSPLAGGGTYDPAAAAAAYKKYTTGLNQYVDPSTGYFLANSPYANWGK